MLHNHFAMLSDALLEQFRSEVLHLGSAIEDQLSLALQALPRREMFLIE